MRNVHMTLPPNYRDLWKGAFQDLKKEDGKERAWLYEADPFRAIGEQAEKQAAADKARQEVASRKASGVVKGASDKPEKPTRWSQAPKVDMGARMRTRVEVLVRERVVWNPYGIKLSQAQKDHIVQDVTKLGFRRSHVEEAVEYCKDREETLEWLLIHVPEDDAPAWSLPQHYSAGASVARGDLKKEATINRLAAAGYAKDLCEQALNQADEDEGSAAEALQRFLMTGTMRDPTAPSQKQLETERRGLEVWEEEQDVLEAIYGERYQRVTPDHCQVELHNRKKATIWVHLRRPVAGHYPHSVPVVFLAAKPPLPAYVRLAAIKRAVRFAETHLGEQMASPVLGWFEDEIVNVIDNPGQLVEVAPAAAALRNGTPGTGAPSRALVTRGRHGRDANHDMGPGANQKMLAQWHARQSTTKQREMMEIRRSLPAWRIKESLVETIYEHRVTIISGETGSGKSTQSVQFILDDMIQRIMGASANIICTQPRRISALGLADRVSSERCSPIGEEVGYAIRGESKNKVGVTKIKFVTTGVLLRQLQSSCREGDDGLKDALSGISHVVVDEVHERSLDTDLLLALLRRVLDLDKQLKVILMSATLDADIFARYFGVIDRVGRVEIEGRTFPVEDHYLEDVLRMTGDHSHTDLDGVKGAGRIRPSFGLDEASATDSDGIDGGVGSLLGYDTEMSIATASEAVTARLDYDLLARAVAAIDEQLGSNSGGILIFLPGVMEIDKTMQALRQLPGLHVLPLHASLPPHEQKKVFLRPARGSRKVIAATNVAETSITIEDVVAVIDSGRVKETSFDPRNNLVTLREVWASKAACKQRRGRAGRAQSGKCFKLFTRRDETTRMRDRPEPEIRRVPLEQLCLSVKAMGVRDVRGFVAATLTPPHAASVEGAMTMLGRIGALDGDELTALGGHLAAIPADLRCAKLMVYGATFGCLEASLSIAAILTCGNASPFVAPLNKRDEAKAARRAFSADGGGVQGDALTDLRAYDEWCRVQSSCRAGDVRAWCDRNFLSARVLNDIASTRSQYLVSLKESGFIPSSYDPSYSFHSSFTTHHHRGTHPASSSSSSSIANTASASGYSDAPTDVVARYNVHHDNAALIRALIAGAFTPQIARIVFPEKRFAPSMAGAVELDPEARTIKYFSQENGRVFVHPGSTLFTGGPVGGSVGAGSGGGAGIGSVGSSPGPPSTSSGFTTDSAVKYLSYFSKITSATSNTPRTGPAKTGQAAPNSGIPSFSAPLIQTSSNPYNPSSLSHFAYTTNAPSTKPSINNPPPLPPLSSISPSKIFIRDLTPFNVWTLLLFSGPITLDPTHHGLVVDGWLYLRGWARIAVLVSRMRSLLDAVLARKAAEPSWDSSRDEVVQVVRAAVERDGRDL